MAASLIAGLRRVAPEVAGWPASHRTALAVPAVVAAAVSLLLVPEGPWHTNYHDLGVLEAIEHPDLLHPVYLQHIHGPGHIALHRVARLVSFRLLSPFDVASLLSGVSIAALFGLVRTTTGSAPRAFAAACVLAAAPVHLRLAATPSYFPVSEHTTLWALWMVELAARDRKGSGAAVTSVALAMTVRAENLVLVPGLVLAWLTLRHGTGWLQRPTRRELWISAGVLLCLAPVLTRAAGVVIWGLSVADPGGQRDIGPLLTALAVLAAALAGRALLARHPRRVAGIAAGGAAIAVLTGAAMVLRGTRILGVGRSDEAVLLLHAWFHPLYTPTMWWAWIALGLAALWWRAPRLLAFVAAAWFATTVPHAWSADASSTFVRTSLLGAWVYAWVGGEGIAILTERLPGLPARAALAAALAVAPVWSHREWISHPIPEQQEFGLIARARALVEEGATVALLSPVDTSPDSEFRERIAWYVGRPPLRTSLSCFPDDEAAIQAGAYYLQTADCFRAQVDRHDPTLHRLGVDGRVFAVGRLAMGPRDLIKEQPVPVLDLLVPCWNSPAQQRCVEPTDDGCDTWTCAPDAVAPVDVGYLADACQRMWDRYTLEPVQEIVPAASQNGGLMTNFHRRDARLGLYRITGLVDDVGSATTPPHCR